VGLGDAAVDAADEAARVLPPVRSAETTALLAEAEPLPYPERSVVSPSGLGISNARLAV